jgi:hypothetical protein
MSARLFVQPLLFASPVYYPDRGRLDSDCKTIADMLDSMDENTSLFRPARIVSGDADLEDALASLERSVPLLVPLSGGVQKRMIASAEAASESLLWTWFPNDDLYSGEVRETVLRIVSKNALPAAADVWAALRNSGRRIGKVYHRMSWEAAANGLSAAHRVRGARILIVGYTQEWVVSASVDTRKMQRLLGISSVHIGLEELFAEFEACRNDSVSSSLAKDFSEGAKACLEPDMDQIEKAFRMYRSLKNLLVRHGCNALAISCFSLAKTLGVTACVALSMLNDEPDTIAACEGDLDAAVSMIVGKAVTGLPIFMGNPVYNLDNTLDIVHCTAPRKLLGGVPQPYEIRSHHETGLSVSQRVEVEEKLDATIFRIGNEFRNAVVFEAPLIGNPRLDTCRTQFRFALKSWEKNFDALLGCHHMVAFGRFADPLARFLRERLGLEVTVL